MLTGHFMQTTPCISPEMVSSGAHVTEISSFGTIYGAQGWHYYRYVKDHIRSFALDTLIQNDYAVGKACIMINISMPAAALKSCMCAMFTAGSIAASVLWLYPNRFLMNQFPFFVQRFDNEVRSTPYVFGLRSFRPSPWCPLRSQGLMEEFDHFISRREEDQRNFFLFLFFDKFKEKGHHFPSCDVLHMKVLDRLRKANFLDDKSMVVFASDHGVRALDDIPFLHVRLSSCGVAVAMVSVQDMHGEHGEQGHSQLDSSWWAEKVLVRSIIRDDSVPYPST